MKRRGPAVVGRESTDGSGGGDEPWVDGFGRGEENGAVTKAAAAAAAEGAVSIFS